jgi:cellulose synthase (UDP-forming)
MSEARAQGKVTIEFTDENLSLSGTIQLSAKTSQGKTIRIVWEPLAIADYRPLVEILFCRPGRWQGRVNPGELKIIFLLLTRLLHPWRLIAQARRQQMLVQPSTFNIQN